MFRANQLPTFLFRKLLLSGLLLCSLFLCAQDSATLVIAPDASNTKPQTSNPTRFWLVAGGHAAFWAGSYIALNKAWYADYPKQHFHFFNDNREWNNMDKAGHFWTTYQISRISGDTWRWAGLSRSKSAWLGGISGLAYQSIIEIQDGFSAEWGFSITDMLCNIAGAGLYVGQELGWKEQRITLKLSYWPYDYNTPQLKARRDQLYGASFPEHLIKEYNAQTIWLSLNLQSLFMRESNFPKWLNIAVGYGASGLFGGHENKWKDDEGNVIDRTDIPRVRSFYISPDIDLKRIKTRSKFLRSVLSVVNCLKIPAPAIEFNSRGKVTMHAIYY